MGEIRRISPVKTRRLNGIFSWVKHGKTMGLFLGGGPKSPQEAMVKSARKLHFPSIHLPIGSMVLLIYGVPWIPTI